MGCAYEPSAKSAAPQYVLVRGIVPMLDWAPSVCPYYLGRLPMVAEALAALPHWKAGTLTEWCGGPPTRAMLAAVAELDNAREGYAQDPNRPKGEA